MTNPPYTRFDNSSCGDSLGVKVCRASEQGGAARCSRAKGGRCVQAYVAYSHEVNYKDEKEIMDDNRHQDTMMDELRFSPGEVKILSMLLWIAKRVFEDDKTALADILSMEHALQAGEHADVMGGHWLDIEGHPRRVKEEVFDILEMWDCLELTYELLPSERQGSIDARLGEFSELRRKFRGYDGHIPEGEEGYLSYTRYVLDRNRYRERFKDRQLDGLVGPKLPRYQEMLRKYNEYKEGFRAENPIGLWFDWDGLRAGRVAEDTLQTYEDLLADLFSTDNG